VKNCVKIKRREFKRSLTVTGTGVGVVGLSSFSLVKNLPPEKLKIGIVGLSVHSAAFSQILNDSNKKSDLEGCRITALFHPKGNPDVDFSNSQLKKFEDDVKKIGVKVVGSMSELLKMVDGVMLLTNDGRPHLDQAMPAFKAGKPVFIDKPIAASLEGVVEIFEKARHLNIPVFTSSALRYLESAQKIERNEVLGANTYSPAPIEASHTDLFWDGIHGVELLYTVMGVGCKEVIHAHHTKSEDRIIGYWNDGRVGVFRGIREGKRDFGGTVFGENDIISLDEFNGYRPLVVKIVEFFQNRNSPVPIKETLEIYTFMEAAQESKRRGGIKVSLEEVLKEAY
jgi:predicted dehydrogenase